jgi:predicted acetyltransferase
MWETSVAALPAPRLFRMTTLHLPPLLADHSLLLRQANEGDQDRLERLWLLFRHHMSEFTGALPNPDGTYWRDRLDAALCDPTWQAWLVLAGDHPVGLALLRAIDQPVRVINSFFIVAALRSRGIGAACIRTITNHAPGSWTVAYQEANSQAARFWQRVAAGLDPSWTVEHRPVPHRPDLPPDVWVTFTVAEGSGPACTTA